MIRVLVRSLALAVALPVLAATPEPPADLKTPPADAEKTASGLVTKKLADGTGTEHARPNDLARLHYTVWKDDGTLVQHVEAPKSATLPIYNMIPGWGESVAMMVTGEKRRAWIPLSLTGGKTKTGLVIDSELIEIIKAPDVPEDVAEVPANAVKTGSGLASRLLREGSGDVHPKRRSTVVVHYSGWTTDGKMFDSSVLRGKPAEFPLDAVIAGWTEGVQLMKVGEKRRFWIPARLAYAKDPTKPQGMLVFDIELLEIK